MNLLWSLARNMNALSDEKRKTIIEPLMESLNNDLDKLKKDKINQDVWAKFLSNFTWSCYVLEIKEQKVWDNLNTLLR